MITRLYANNFRCLVAFEAKFDPFCVLCGPNGAGKSSVFDALSLLRDLASGNITLEQAINYQDHTNWLDSKVVEFEVDIQAAGRTFMYRLHIEQLTENVPPIIIREQANCDGKILFERDRQGVRLLTLMVWADVDDDLPDGNALKEKFWQIAEKAGVERANFDNVVFIFARDRLENWIEFLNTSATNETQEGPRLANLSEAANAARKLADMCSSRASIHLPPSLEWSCKNWRALVKRMSG